MLASDVVQKDGCQGGSRRKNTIGEIGDLASDPGRCHPGFARPGRFHERGVRQFLRQLPCVGELVKGVEVVANHESRLRQATAFLRWGDDLAKEDSPEGRRNGTEILAQPIQSDIGEVTEYAGNPAKQTAEWPQQRFGQYEAEAHRREQAEDHEEGSRPDHRHLQDHAVDAFGLARRDFESLLGSIRWTAEYRGLDAEVIQECDRLIDKLADGVMLDGIGPLRLAMAKEVESQDPETSIGQGLGQRGVEGPREQPRREQHNGLRPSAKIVVHQGESIEDKLAGPHVLGPGHYAEVQSGAIKAIDKQVPHGDGRSEMSCHLRYVIGIPVEASSQFP